MCLARPVEAARVAAGHVCLKAPGKLGTATGVAVE